MKKKDLSILKVEDNEEKPKMDNQKKVKNFLK